jgi:predicted DsbA family dithiol-disulfide isomerase
MGRARRSRGFFPNARGALALLCALGSVACGRSSQADAHTGQIDLTSPGGPAWPAEEREAEEPQLTDADVERISVRLPHQRVPVVSAQNPSKGPADAKVTLQVFSDFECPFCVRSASTLADVAERFRGQLRVVWRNYPLPSHDRARPAARAALEAFAQGGSDKFWKLHDWLYSPQADLSDAGLRRGAAALSLDAARVVRAAQGRQYDPQIDLDMAAGDAAGIEGTPAVFINDYYLMGARHRVEYSVVVERALREARELAQAR